MASRTRLAASLAVAVVLSTGAAARAAEPPVEEVPLEFEAGRTAGQFLLGVVTAAAGSWLAISTRHGGTVVVVLALTPAAVGGATCAAGLEGRHDGSCAATILGAYLGAATLVPLAYLGHRSEPPPPPDGARDLYYGNAIVGAAIGWLLMQPLGATLGWHFSRSPRQLVTVGPPLPSVLPLQAMSPERRRRPFARGPRPLVPVLSLRF